MPATASKTGLPPSAVQSAVSPRQTCHHPIRQHRHDVDTAVCLQGAKKQGITTHVRVKKKFDNSGVGQAEADKRAQDWTVDMHKFSTVLGGLKEVKSPHASVTTALPSSKAPSASGVPPSASVPKQPKKKKKRDRGAANELGDGGAAASIAAPSGAQDVADTPATGERQRVKVASHSGRYTKREHNKRVQGYSANDLAAILGHTSAGARPPPSP